MEEKLKFAVFVDYDNIEIGVRTTLNRDLDIEIILEGIKQRGEIVSKVAYGNWSHHSDATRAFTDYGVQMVQRDSTPRGDKNGADINLALDALEMAFTRDHINAFAIISGDSDFMALVNKLKQYNKRIYIVSGKQFTSNILQRNCHEFISYESLLDILPSRSRRGGRSRGAPPRSAQPISQAIPLLDRALNALDVRGVQPQLGLLKSTMQQLDPAFSERDYGVSSFSNFVKKLVDNGYVNVRAVDNHQVVDRREDDESAEEAAADEETQAREETTSQEEGQPREEQPRETRESRERESGGRSRRGRRGRGRGRGRQSDEAPAEASGRTEPAGRTRREPEEDDIAPPGNRKPREPLEFLTELLSPHRDLLSIGIPQREVAALIRAAEPNFSPLDLGFDDFADLLAFAEDHELLESRLDSRDALRYFPGAKLEELGGGEAESSPEAREGGRRRRRRRRRGRGPGDQERDEAGQAAEAARDDDDADDEDADEARVEAEVTAEPSEPESDDEAVEAEEAKPKKAAKKKAKKAAKKTVKKAAKKKAVKKTAKKAAKKVAAAPDDE